MMSAKPYHYSICLLGSGSVDDDNTSAIWLNFERSPTGIAVWQRPELNNTWGN
jgi:hypothetical protein